MNYEMIEMVWLYYVFCKAKK